MEGLVVHERPGHQARFLVAAFAGWPDAAQASTNAVRFLARLTDAKVYAEIDPDPFFVLTEVRPHTFVDKSGRRGMSWPESEFSYSDPGRREPHLHPVSGDGAKPSLAILHRDTAVGGRTLRCGGGRDPWGADGCGASLARDEDNGGGHHQGSMSNACANWAYSSPATRVRRASTPRSWTRAPAGRFHT